MKSNSNGNSGMGICGVLTVIFIVLKCLGVIEWSWVWVFSPLWIEAIIIIVVLAILEVVLSMSRIHK